LLLMHVLRPPALAFDAIARGFDQRFGPWQSVAAQRRAVRAALLQAFPQYGDILELGGGTGEDAAFLAGRGFSVLLTDPSPAMVSVAREKLRAFDGQAAVASGEEMEIFARKHLAAGGRRFDGAFSNFAPMNCVADLRPVARGLSDLLKPGAALLLVVFGSFCPAEMVTEIMRRRPNLALRRFKRGDVPARLGGREFRVIYHRRVELIRAFSPWFTLEKRLGIGITVPPSAAEPWISGHPRLLAVMENLDRILAQPFAMFGDHILFQFRRAAN
jgi:SAM-dependent methyltransferase